MPEFGQFALRLGLFLSVYAILADLLGRWRNRSELLVSARNATIGCLLCLTVAATVLWVLLVQGDFAVSYVAEHTARALPLVYKLTAFWAGASGSLLLWLWLQTGFIVLAFSRCSGGLERFCAAARATANFVAVFFFLVLIFDKDPFSTLATAPGDGAGLNPLLQHPAMVLHPPALFLGYAAFAVPCVWAFAILKQEDSNGVSVLFDRARNWSLVAWIFLTIGIGLGAWWAYEELGWGGYWAWDPVENSSLMPWLTATALLHCARTYRANSRTATWFMVLAIVTFSLCIFGTFLTRYGLVSSVHAFPEPGLGILFLVLMAVLGVIAGLLFLHRHRQNKLKAQPESRSSRFVVWNNWLMLLLTFVILVGTLFPFLSALVSKAGTLHPSFSALVSKDPITLKPDYFTKITSPGGLLLLLLLGVCPHLIHHGLGRSWRLVGAVLVGISAAVIWGLAGNLPIAYLVASAFVGLNLAADFVQRYARRRTSAAAPRLSATLRWYGARIVHIGVLFAFVGIAGSGGFDVKQDVALRPGQQVQVGKFELTYNDLDAEHGPNFTAVKAEISVSRGQKQISTLRPALAFYPKSENPTSEVSIRRTLAGDLYVALGDVDRTTKLINLTIFIKPLINWIWIGSGLMVVGAALVVAAAVGRRQDAFQGEMVEA